VAKAEELQPDVLVTDISMPGLNGLEVTRRVKSSLPQVQVVILSMHADDEYIFQVLGAGASGYVLKQAASKELISAIQTVWRGEPYLSPTVSRRVLEEFIRRGKAISEPDSYDTLTDREREVLQLVAEGHTSKEIGKLLHLGVKTVETHRSHVMDKLGIRGTAALTQYAIQKGIIKIE
jgi:two-component system response regulator NreC